MIARRLDTVLRECIQVHADQHRFGILDIEEIHSSLLAIAAEHFARIEDPSERQQRFNEFCIVLADNTNQITNNTDLSVGMYGTRRTSER